MPIPIPAPMAPTAMPIQTTSDLVGMELATAGSVAAVTSKAQTTALARILFRPAFIAHLMSIQVLSRLLTIVDCVEDLQCSVPTLRCGESVWQSTRGRLKGNKSRGELNTHSFTP